MAILDNVKEVARLAQEYGKIDLYEKVVTLMAQVTDLAAENFELKQQVAELRAKLEMKGKATYDIKSHTYQVDGKGAYCATCFDQHGALQRLHAVNAVQDQKHPDEMGVQWECGRCGWKSDWKHLKRDVLEWPRRGEGR
jgi:hypothetical protein